MIERSADSEPRHPKAQSDTISVAIATYNCSAYLPDAINSLLCQSCCPHEIIVVDDGSTDDTSERMAPYENRIIYIRQQNMGVSAARNAAIALASGAYVAMLDADDICAPDRLEKQLLAMNNHPEAIACFTGHWVFDSTHRISEFKGEPDIGTLDSIRQLARCMIWPPTIFFRREAAAGLGYPHGVATGEDMIFLALLRTRGPFIVLPEPLYGSRRRPNQATQIYGIIDGFEQRLAWVSAHWNEYWPNENLITIEQAMWNGLAETLADFYWARKRGPFLQIREYLKRKWPSNIPPRPECSWPWYPDWIMHAKSCFDGIRTRIGRHCADWNSLGR